MGEKGGEGREGWEGREKREGIFFFFFLLTVFYRKENKYNGFGGFGEGFGRYSCGKSTSSRIIFLVIFFPIYHLEQIKTIIQERKAFTPLEVIFYFIHFLHLNNIGS